jgi:DNA polymerase III subunit delta'
VPWRASADSWPAWRHVGFADIIGHERVKALLGRALRARRLPPALLLAGPEGVGKKTLALATARSLLCERQDGDACDTCPACSRARRGLHPDLLLVEPATASIKIEQIRDTAREIAGRPFEGRARAFVIDGAHLLTEQAANALLKSLEEPPSTSHVLLVTAAPQALLPTVRSRCQLLRLGPLPQALLASQLQQRLGLAPDEAWLRAALAGGSLGAALDFASEEYRGLREQLLALLERIRGADALVRLEAAQALGELEDPGEALVILRSLLRDAAVLRLGAPSSAVQNGDVAARLAALAEGPVGARAIALAAAAGETREALFGNANKLLSMDLLMDVLAG